MVNAKMGQPGFYQAIIILIFSASTFLLTGCGENTIKEKYINIAFRYDDYSLSSRTDAEIRIIDAFREIGAMVTFGVIPNIHYITVDELYLRSSGSAESKKWKILKSASDAGIVDIALHGYSHRTTNPKDPTEFSDIEFSRQLERIGRGKDYLERVIGTSVTTFIPPWNSYDLNTLRALKNLRFSTISASTSGKGTRDFGLKFVPATCDLSQVREAVIAAKTSDDTQTLIVVLFHAYDFKEIDKDRGQTTYPEFLNLLNWVKSQRGVRLMSVAQATIMIKDLGGNRFLLNKLKNTSLNFIPLPFRQGHEHYIYSGFTHELLKMWLLVALFYLVILTITVFASFMSGCWIYQKSPLKITVIYYLSIATLVIMISYAFHDMQIHYRGMMAISVMVGVCVGLGVCSSLCGKKKYLGMSFGEKSEKIPQNNSPGEDKPR